jgi:lipopolysaccharide cholinephosphotransferase
MIYEHNTLKQLQNVLHEILDEFVRICEENSLTYFLASGTLLGAVRHKGFIPWDDDIDVAMPRKDYEIFLNIFENNTETNYYVLSNRGSQNKFMLYRGLAKFCKEGTIFAASNIPNPDKYPGIFIDI